jgi:hypothetical protein
MNKKPLLCAVGLLALVATAAMANPVPSTGHAERFTGALTNLALGARFGRPFVLSIDHYSSEADLERMSETLQAKGPYALRDELFKLDAGTLSLGGGLGYPVAAVVERETSNGRTLYVFLNRPLRGFEVSHATRSSKYPFEVLELNLDRNDRGNGQMIAAAKLRKSGDNLEIESLGFQPFRLSGVRAD